MMLHFKSYVYSRARCAGLVISIVIGAAALVAAPEGGALMPRISPDGNWIAVSYQGSIGRISLNGRSLTALSQGEGWDTDPAWSPDGRQIAYVSSPLRQLHLIDAADGTAVALGKFVRGTGPLWFHPDGRRVLGRFSIGTGPWLLAWLQVESCELTPVTLGELEARLDINRAYASPYALSADGRWMYLALHADITGEQTGNNGPQSELFRIYAAGGPPERILQFPARIYGLSTDGGDGGLFVVTDRGTSHNDIWHIPFDEPARGARKVTVGQADEDSPTIQRGGRWLVHTENSGGATRLIRHNIDTGNQETIRFDRVDYRRATGSVRLEIPRGDEMAARFSVKQRGGKFHAPPGALYRTTAGLGHFYARGVVQLELRVGSYEVRVFHGPEYRMFAREFEVRAGGMTSVAIELKRWTNAPARGWYSGENHIHANYGYGAWYNTPQSIFDQCEGEDLHVGNIVVANSDGEGVFDREFFMGRPDSLSTAEHIIYWNQEFRSTLWGHMTLFNLDRLVEPIFTGFLNTTNPWDIPTNADVAERTAAQGGAVSYTHPARNLQDFYNTPTSGKGLPVDVALGRIDAMDVMGGFFQETKLFWYKVLNCGFRIPAAAGTDCFLNRVASYPPGYGRVYVHLPNGLNYKAWVSGVKAGRSFVSNGPMIEFAVDGRMAGDVLKHDRPVRLRAQGRADSQFPLEKLEVVFNGTVVATGQLAADRLSATIDQEIEVSTGGWIALHVVGPAVAYWAGGPRGAHESDLRGDERAADGQHSRC